MARCIKALGGPRLAIELLLHALLFRQTKRVRIASLLFRELLFILAFFGLLLRFEAVIGHVIGVRLALRVTSLMLAEPHVICDGAVSLELLVVELANHSLF